MTVPSRRRRTKAELLEDDGDTMNDRPKVARPLGKNRISFILRNPFYTGQIIGPDGGYMPSTSHEALVDIKTFMRVQSLLKTNRTSRHYDQKLSYPFRGFIRCAECRRVYTPYQKKGIYYYGPHCVSGCGNSLRNCNFNYVSNLGRKILTDLQITPEELAELDADAPEKLRVAAEQRENETRRREREGRRLAEELKYLNDNQLSLLKAGLYTPETLLSERTRLEEEIAVLRAAEDAQTEENTDLVADVKKISELLNMALDLYDFMKPHEKDRAGRMLVSELRIDQNTFDCSPQPALSPLFNRKSSACAPNRWFSELSCEKRKRVIDVLSRLTDLPDIS